MLTGLVLRNYRVFEEELELALPPGMLGIYGANGAGKSTLVESVMFALFGRSRTSNAEVRTSGVTGECVAEVTLEHEGHLYRVRRTIGGINATVRAQAWADGLQVAEGTRDTTRYARSVLGMDDAAFRASVFAEQKQVASFSALRPAERRGLVLRLLGITPVDAARDQARRDARDAGERFTRFRDLLPDMGALRMRSAEAERVAREAEARRGQAVASAAAARRELAEAEREHERLDHLGRECAALVVEGKAARRAQTEAAGRLASLESELIELERVGADLERLEPEAELRDSAEAAARAARAVAAAAAELSELPRVPDLDPLAETAARAEQAEAEAGSSRNALAVLEGRLTAARAELAAAAGAVGRSETLSGEADCPLCGQSLGAAAQQVRVHREAERARIAALVASLEEEHSQRTAEAADRWARAAAAAAALGAARDAWSEHRRVSDQRHQAEHRLRRALIAAGETAEGEDFLERAEEWVARIEGLDAQAERRRQAAAEVERLRARVERRPTVVSQLDDERRRTGELEDLLATLRDKVAGLGYRPTEADSARQRVQRARQAAEDASTAASAAATHAAGATARAEEAARTVAEAAEQHRGLGALEEEARHLGRLAELLATFRNTLVGTVGPRLAAQAAELFAELTAHEYDRLDVDPETYEIRISDAGVVHGMDRFSGSETDLANLALRVAISEQVRFQSGGQVGLLVLDEVFGPLDAERKATMLEALNRLAGRFRQILVVTHDAEVKEQLPNAVEVIKLPGRRATARLLAS
ncbi:MAG: AAA family ATPase [Acidimicrobiales bacterium]